jgi:AraC family transcriptional regulator
MKAQSERGNTADLASGIKPEWLGNSLSQGPKVEISRIKSWPSLTAMSYRRDGGEIIVRSDRPRLVLMPDPHSPALVQIEHGPAWEPTLAGPDSLSFVPAGVTMRVVDAAASRVAVVWDTDFCSTLLPELGAVESRFEFLFPLQDPLLSQLVTTLAQEIEGGFADRILVEKLGTALYIRIARCFVGHLPLPTSGGLSPERLERVRDYVEAHPDDDLSLTMLADIACLSPYHFSRSFKQATGVGP